MKYIVYINKIIKSVRKSVLDDVMRSEMLFRGLNIALSLIALGMTVVNVFTKEYTLMLVTFLFFVLCAMNAVFKPTGRGGRILRTLFYVEFLVLLAFFFISGIPDGFSALWACLVPSFALLVFGIASGTRLSLLVLAGIIFLFWFPQGKALLQYEYSSTFMLRFPFLYSAVLAISILIEYIRMETQRNLFQLEDKYKKLYNHDALTGLYNRFGMNEILDEMFAHPEHCRLSVMIMDIDDFKMVNDRYGHNAGDEVLKYVARVLEESTCEHCSCARWGGEEFLVLMECEHDPKEMAEKLRRNFESAVISYEEEQIRITMSIGLFIARDASKYTLHELVKYADQCLYRSKKEGKNRVTVYE